MALNLKIQVSRPPRKVPLSTRLVVLFGGMLSAFGWFFFSFGMIFAWVFGCNGDYLSALVMHGHLETAPAVVEAVEKSGFSEGGSKHSSGTPIYAYHFKFKPGGTASKGTSYRTVGGGEAGDEVTVEFPAGKPAYARIRGMRRAVFGPVVAFVFIFPAVGLGLTLPGVWRGWKSLGLLVHGETAQGILVKKEPTNVSVNHQTVYKLTFEFTDRIGQTRQAIAKTYLPEKLEANRAELLFYDPIKPEKATLLDNLPGKQSLTDRGDLKPCGFWAGLKAVLGPVAALVVVLGGLALKLV